MSNPSNSSRRNPKHSRAILHCLEPRCLLSSSLNSGTLTIVGTTGNDTVTVNYNVSGGYTVNISGEPNVVYAPANVARLMVYLGPGNDNFFMDAAPASTTVLGGTGRDTITSGSGNDLLFGGHGSDVIYGEAGDDTVIGGRGNDDVYGDDWLDYPANGNDLVIGGTGHDTLHGGHGNDTLFAGPGNDYMNGGDGTDRIYGGLGINHFSIQTDTTAGIDMPSEVLDLKPADVNDLGPFVPSTGGIQGGTFNTPPIQVLLPVQLA